ncbi:2-isopropylmalate synthase [Prosthecobacter sp.]|jgi:isopropylmalate/homocitrate/citramalate synthase|uniref:2-isopropylmalate synthase n=1 Tax=Prosthecobacter sp. TaxID=1965333 RepID=UPI0025E11233|nr:2-isopropylmalate synthase [Prosthecobacter sp.]
MLKSPSSKYQRFDPFKNAAPIQNRHWPSVAHPKVPIWCSVDLRDGNQALAVPMNVSQKLDMFENLVKCGFKEIEVGFPSASNTEFSFNRRLIEEKRIPDDVTIQCLVQAREDLIKKTVQSLIGAKKVIIHMYNSTSPAQRKYVFGKSKEEIIAVAVKGAQMIKDRLHRLTEGGTHATLQYSPESFSATEVEFAKDISEAVMDVWQPTPQQKMILNLPDTVEVCMPNVYADQIEWICTNIKNRESLIVSLHTHNDRGTGTAATELGLLAGADRVEGTLFGNGERTGNLDIVQVAMNLYMHGLDPKLDFSDMNGLIQMYERTTGMTVPPRQPYAGELVFTAFSGSHQDAIKKGLGDWFPVNGTDPERLMGGSVPYLLKTAKWGDQEKQMLESLLIGFADEPIARPISDKIGQVFKVLVGHNVGANPFEEDIEKEARTVLEFLQSRISGQWDVPYLTIDPNDIGREYHEVIRVNSQSGKGGVAYLLESEFGIELPKDMQREFGPIANDIVDSLGREVSGAELKQMFWKEYIEREAPFQLYHFHADGVDGVFTCRCSLVINGKERGITGKGNGPIAAFADALVQDAGASPFEVATYREQSLSSGTGASALAFIQIKTATGKLVWGAGTDTNIELASIKAVLSAVNRAV